jgi:predicted Zn-dependent protease
MGYRFAVLDGDEVQAVSAPGGFVFVTIGALRRAEDEDELAALLAHEIAHVSLEHGLKAIKAATRNTSFQLLAKAGGEGALQATGSGGSRGTAAIAGLATNLGDVVSDITGDLLVKGYSRELELEADAAAAKYLESSGYARAALAAYLERLQSGGGAGGWFDTHPAPAERIAALGAAPAAAPEPRAARRERFLASLKR